MCKMNLIVCIMPNLGVMLKAISKDNVLRSVIISRLENEFTEQPYTESVGTIMSCDDEHIVHKLLKSILIIISALK